jgi:putative hydrolase of the HAD superfamily
MTVDPIRAVVFDMGGTLEELYYDETIRREATRSLRDFLLDLDLDPGLSLPDLQAAVSSGLEAYYAWRAQKGVELPAEGVWPGYIFANHDLPAERLAAAADDIALFYETHYYVRSLRPEAPAVLEALRKRALRLAIVSNTLSRQLVPRKLAEYGIAAYFDPVVTSAALGWRKPNPRIFEEATRLMRVPPGACSYVGDTVSRDVLGARRAGYGLVIQIKSFLTDRADRGTPCVPPDAVVRDLWPIVDLVDSGTGTVHGH